MITMKIANSLGILGVLITLFAYLLLQINKIVATSFSYSFLNLAGSCLILFSLFFEWNLPAALMEIAWGLVSLYGLYKWQRSDKRPFS